MRESVLKRLLAERGIKVVWFAENILSMTHQMVDHVEAGRIRAPAGYHERCAAFFHMSLADYLTLIASDHEPAQQKAG